MSYIFSVITSEIRNICLGARESSMPKFIMSLGDSAYQFLRAEAKDRSITVQELLKVVIIPEWVKRNSHAQMERVPNLVRPLIRA